MRYFITLLISSLILTMTLTATAAPVQWTEGNGHWYEYFNLASVSWHEAATLAGSNIIDGYQGHLATITTPEENAFIWNSLNHPRGAWLGGYQSNDAIVPPGSWNWITGEGWDYTNWLTNMEPNDGDYYPLRVEDHEQDYLGFNSSYDSPGWGDHAGTELRHYIVEYEMTNVPIPTSIFLLGSGLLGLVGLKRREKLK